MIRQFTPDARTSLDTAKNWVRENLADGVECPCCLQIAKIYKRKLNSSMAFALLLIDRYFRQRVAEEWLHVPSYLNECDLEPAVAAAIRGDWAKLVHWDLLEERDDERPDGSRRAGFYRITLRGRDFAAGKLKVPRHVFLYNAQRIERRGQAIELIDVHQALDDRFSYAEIMQGAR